MAAIWSIEGIINVAGETLYQLDMLWLWAA